MSIVEHQGGIVPGCKVDQLRHASDLSAHREDPVRRDQFSGAWAILRSALQKLLQVLQVVVPVTHGVCKTDLRALDDAGVVILIRKDNVVPAGDRLDDALVGHVAGRKEDGFILPHKVSQPALELQVQVQRPVEETASGTARPVLLHGVLRRFLDAGVGGEPEIVVRAGHDDLLAVHVSRRPLASVDRTKVGVQVCLLCLCVISRLIEEALAFVEERRRRLNGCVDVFTAGCRALLRPTEVRIGHKNGVRECKAYVGSRA